MKTRIGTAVVSCLLVLGCSGCFFESGPPRVYFENNTDQDFVLYPRDPATTEVPRRLPARVTTGVALVAEGHCTSEWLIYNQDRTKVVKDPGSICTNQTVKIP